MTEQPQPVSPAAGPALDAAAAEPATVAADPAAAAAAVGTDDHPEIAVGAAFAGGFLAALILKRLGR